MEWKLKPARDHELTPRAKLSSLKREGGLASLISLWCWRQATRLYLRLYHRFSVTGADNLPAPPFVMVANHSSHLDILALTSALPARYLERVHPIAAEDHFFASFSGSLFAAMAINALPLKRKAARGKDLALLRERLAEDRLIYVLFPEGTRSRDGRMAPFKAGIGALLAASDVPVVPCCLEGAFAALPPQRHWPRPARLRLAIGKPIGVADCPNDRGGWIEVASRCEKEVRRLAGYS
jgi:1-acyl-sn-glycerol-3-phosphate acyltransferase